MLADLPRLPDVAISCIGTLPPDPMPTGAEALRLALRTNGEGPILLLAPLAQAFAKRGAGKATLIAWLSALRNDPVNRALRVVTVLPGFVDTRMTAGLALPKALTATPDEVARAVLRAGERGPEVIHVRRIWRWIMAVITHLPEPLFKRLKL